MTLALRNNALVKSLVSVDNAPVDASLKSDFPRYIEGLRKIEDSSVSKQADADRILERFEEASDLHSVRLLATNLIEQRLPIRQFLLTNLIRSPETGKLKLRIPISTLAASLAKMGDFSFKDPDQIRYEGPTLFVRGTKSHYVADDVLPVIGRFFPRFELSSIDCGHWVISEKPEEFKQGQ